MKNKQLEIKNLQKRAESFSHLISENFLAHCEYIKDNCKTYTILETDECSKLQKIKITKCPNDVYIYQLDETVKFSNYLKTDKKFINKICDFIIFYRQICFVVEIKSDNPNIKDTSHQLKNAELYVKYLNLLNEEFFKMKIKKINKLVIKTGEHSENSMHEKNYIEYIVNPINQTSEFEFSEIENLF